MSRNKQLEVSAIRTGTVIDHIATEHTFHVARILNLEAEPDTVLVAVNLDSGKLGKKGLIKVENKNLTQEMVNKIALVAPQATLNIIEDYTLVRKIRVEIPDKVEGILRCFNPNCITNVSAPNSRPKTLFYAQSKSPLQLRCHHCERVMSVGDMELL